MFRFIYILGAFFLCINSISAQTINIAAIRVEFEQEVEDNHLTTGDGKFLLVPDDAAYSVDPAPHNKRYFADQLIAVNNYFDNVSKGSVRITGDVFPEGDEEAYQLPYEMSYYNSNFSSVETDSGIANLFIDAIGQADFDTAIDFSNYDLIVIFHAGVGKDVNLGYDATPQDIPSLYVNLQFMQKNYNPTFSGISVDNGNVLIEKCIILPETENQDDYPLALTGIFAANIGSYLGLYDLFSASSQRSGIGRFGLMDAGLFNINGLIPAPPSAFHRVLKGWETPKIITTPQNNLKLARYNSLVIDTIPSIIQIPINEDEYYLLEYRGNHSDNIDSILQEIFDQRGEYPDYMEILQTKFEDRIVVDSVSGVLLSVDNYDLGMPGSGILIWHIDNAAIRNAENRLINDDPYWRAVDLEEADGSQDIGEEYTVLDAGWSSELGTWLDYWYKRGVNEYKSPVYRNKFNGSTRPDSRTNLNRIESFISLEEFSSRYSDVMSFNYNRSVDNGSTAFYKEGFPLDLGATPSELKIISGNVLKNGNEQQFIFCINESGEIYTIGNGGNGLLDDNAYLLREIAENIGEVQVQSLALMDTNTVKDGIYDMVVALSGNNLYGIDITSPTADSLNFVISDQITTNINSPIVISSSNNIHFIDYDVIKIYGSDGSLISGDIKIIADELNDLVLGSNGSLYFSDESYNYLARDNSGKIFGAFVIDGETKFTVTDSIAVGSFYADSLLGQFALADIDGNGTTDILFNSVTRLNAHNKNGISIINFPVFPKLSKDEKLIGTPMIIGISGDDDIAIIVTTNKGQILAYDKHGKIVNGFPLAAGGQFSHQAIPIQLDNIGPLELVAISNAGIVSAWEITGTGATSTLIWANTNLDASNNANFSNLYSDINIGRKTVPKKRFFNYPNPNTGNSTTIRYYLNDAADVTLRIFDASGFKIDEFKGPGMADTDNEIDWNVGDVASGVYICQIEVKSGNKTERELIKILVVH